MAYPDDTSMTQQLIWNPATGSWTDAAGNPLNIPPWTTPPSPTTPPPPPPQGTGVAGQPFGQMANGGMNQALIFDPRLGTYTDALGRSISMGGDPFAAYRPTTSPPPPQGTGTAGQPFGQPSWFPTVQPPNPLNGLGTPPTPVPQAPIAQAQNTYQGGDPLGGAGINWLNTPTAQAFSSGQQTTMSPAAFASLSQGMGGRNSGYTPGEAASWAQNYGGATPLTSQQTEFAQKYAADPNAAAAALGISPQLQQSYAQSGWNPSQWPEYTAAYNKLPANVSNNPTYGSRAQNWYLPEPLQKLGWTNSASALPMLAQAGWNGSYDDPQFTPVAGAPANYDYTTLKSIAAGMKPGFINDPVTGQNVGSYDYARTRAAQMAAFQSPAVPFEGPRHDGDTLNDITDNPQTTAYVNNTLGGSNYGGVIQPPPPLDSDPWGTLNGEGFDSPGGDAAGTFVPEQGFANWGAPSVNTQFLRDIGDINFSAYAMSGTNEPDMQKWLGMNPNAQYMVPDNAKVPNAANNWPGAAGAITPMTEGGVAPQQQAAAPQAGYGNLPGLANTGAQPGYGTAPQSQQSPWQSWGASWGQNNGTWGEDSNNKSGQSFGASPWGKTPWPGVWG